MKIDKNRIENLKKRLYSRNIEPIIDDRRSIVDHEKDISKPDWTDGNSLHIPEKVLYSSYNENSFVKKFFIFAVVFFVMSAIASVFLFFGGWSRTSSQNLDIKVVGPSSVSSGEDTDMTITILNQNKASIEAVSMIIEFPDGVKMDRELENPITYQKYDIGDIKSGESASRPIKFYILGNKDTIKVFNIKVSYKLKGSNAIFTKEKKHEITIGSSPLILNISSPKEINSGQDVSLNISLVSNSPGVLQDVFVKAEYPYGFSFKDASIKPDKGSINEWSLGDIKNGEKKEFVLNGNILAQNNEERTFKWFVSSKGQGGDEIALASQDNTLVVKKSFIDLEMVLDGQKNDIVVSPSEDITGEISLTNTLFDKLSNVNVNLKFQGNYFDRNSVRPSSGGFYESINNNIVWNKNTNTSLSEINPSDERNFLFFFNMSSIPASVKNPSIVLEGNVSGIRSISGGDTESVSTKISKTIKVLTKMSLNAKTSYSGIISNTGPIPPKAEKETTYTIELSLTNTHNDVSNVRVNTILPQYVTFTNVISPSGENVTYNSDTRTVLWNVGNLPASSGFTYSPRKVSFQVKILPSLAQVGIIPDITSEIVATGKDTFTERNIKDSFPPLNTNTGVNDGAVVK